MITVIIPTYNRAYCLYKVEATYYVQKYVTQIIFVDDCSDDNTKKTIEEIAKKYHNIDTIYIRHDAKKGAAACRISGYSIASNDYILFGEDDALLESNYTEVLLHKLTNQPQIGIISGRIIYLASNETTVDALKRFEFGIEQKPYFDKHSFIFNKDAIFKGDLAVPFTHALFMTKKKLLKKFKYDPFYCKGNGYREETDFQLNVFVHGYAVLVTNDTHCFHLHPSDASTGGQTKSRLHRLFWNIYYTSYMYDKYFSQLKKQLSINYSKPIAKLIFASIQLYQLVLKPSLKLPRYAFRRICRWTC